MATLTLFVVVPLVLVLVIMSNGFCPFCVTSIMLLPFRAAMVFMLARVVIVSPPFVLNWNTMFPCPSFTVCIPFTLSVVGSPPGLVTLIFLNSNGVLLRPLLLLVANLPG